MADEENLESTEMVIGVPTIQTLNVVSQKVIQVDKPTGYYGDREKTKINIY